MADCLLYAMVEATQEKRDSNVSIIIASCASHAEDKNGNVFNARKKIWGNDPMLSGAAYLRSQ